MPLSEHELPVPGGRLNRNHGDTRSDSVDVVGPARVRPRAHKHRVPSPGLVQVAQHAPRGHSQRPLEHHFTLVGLHRIPRETVLRGLQDVAEVIVVRPALQQAPGRDAALAAQEVFSCNRQAQECAAKGLLHHGHRWEQRWLCAIRRRRWELQSLQLLSRKGARSSQG